MKITTPIIPVRQRIAIRPNTAHEIDKKALCIYAATGFFLGEDSFYQDEQVLQPGRQYTLNEKRHITASKVNFEWHYSPRNISFQTAVDEFTELYEQIVKEQTGNKRVLLPLSGGLDSRSQAAALHHLGADVHSYSYSFAGGFKEHKISEQIAKVCNFKFDAYLIPKSYLWDSIQELSEINGCYSEFTHARQMALIDEFKRMQGEFSLGHWGDVLFDRGIAAQDEDKSELELIYKKVIKKGGLALAHQLWKAWELDGNFEDYLKHRIQTLLDGIKIDHKASKIRAFKSLYWAPRWTSVNLAVFEAAHPIHLPYYDDRMCEFVGGIPEEYLADRKMQIAYIKNRNPKLAKIMWQDHKPYNLTNYHKNKSPQNLPYRIKDKLQREVNAKLGKKYIQRNWELQFLGEENQTHLESYLYSEDFIAFVGKETIDTMYHNFKEKDAVFYSHSVSMLLTLSAWLKQ
ncbi:asparagine synthase-related protein [Mesonia ostreae]|uniref:asparagine synthase (glutamine-hydrolyzing) n=1 Tax=Mesonia ostreae TaxID=861110 RepID=A0ABU2KLZ2_9FLAO|nr:asparagine synthase-related protein [Mesonia ostreae]MDT0295736.1 asparagine synthase-related protein [Mesonia ostreae]